MIKSLEKYPAKILESIDFSSYLSSELSALNLVLPGDIITTDMGFMHGHGTYEKDGVVYSSLMGTVEKTDKLLLVNPIRTKYTAEVGDVIIGKVKEISNKKWIVDIDSNTEASLHLNSTFLPDQRKKTQEDELNMRNLFKENDLITTEVHSLNHDRTINLHTRSLKYGKLEHGILINVHNKLLKRQKHHFIKLNCDIHLILGHNGAIWISTQENTQIRDLPQEQDSKFNITREQLEKMSRIRNIIKLLDNESIEITVDNINELYELSQEKKMLSKELLIREIQIQLLSSYKKKIEAKIPKEISKLLKQGEKIGI